MGLGRPNYSPVKRTGDRPVIFLRCSPVVRLQGGTGGATNARRLGTVAGCIPSTTPLNSNPPVTAGRRGRTVPEWANMVGPFGGITRRHHRAGGRAASAAPWPAHRPDRQLRGPDLRRRVRHRDQGRQDQPVQSALDRRAQPGRRRQDHRDRASSDCAGNDLGRHRGGTARQAPAPEEIVPVDPAVRRGVVRQLRHAFRRRRHACPAKCPWHPPTSTTTLWVRNNAFQGNGFRARWPR